jgi:Putative prokaryotic signal transducing protein
MPDESANTITAEDGTTLVEIASVGTEDEASLLQGFLEAEGIPAQIENVKFNMEPINFGAMGEIRVFVTLEDEPRAQQLLREREREYEEHVDDDDEIDEDAQAESDDGATS